MDGCQNTAGDDDDDDDDDNDNVVKMNNADANDGDHSGDDGDK